MGGILGQIANVGMGLLLGGVNDSRQLSQQGSLLKQQLKYDKNMAEFNAGLAYDMWEKTGYGGQVRQMKEAGINPALMYGMGGGGGQTANAGGGGHVSAASAPQGGMGMEMGAALQMAMLNAQKENIEADTEKKKAETEKTAGVDTQLGETQIKSITQGIENQKAVEVLTKVQTDIARIDEWIKGESQEDAANLIMWQAQKTMNEANNLWQQGIVDKATMDNRIKIIAAELAKKYVDIKLGKAQITNTKADTKLKGEQTSAVQHNIHATDKGTQLTDVQITAVIRQGVQKWQELMMMGQNADANTRRLQWEQVMKDVPESERVIMGFVEELMESTIKRK